MLKWWNVASIRYKNYDLGTRSCHMCIPSIFYVFSGCDTVSNFYSKKNVKYGMFGCKIFPTLMSYSFVIEIDQVMSQKQTLRSLKTSFWRCSKCIYIIYICHIYIYIYIYIYISYISALACISMCGCNCKCFG